MRNSVAPVEIVQNMGAARKQSCFPVSMRKISPGWMPWEPAFSARACALGRNRPGGKELSGLAGE